MNQVKGTVNRVELVGWIGAEPEQVTPATVPAVWKLESGMTAAGYLSNRLVEILFGLSCFSSDRNSGGRRNPFCGRGHRRGPRPPVLAAARQRARGASSR